MIQPLPPAFIQSLQGTMGFDEEQFVLAHHQTSAVTSIRVNPQKWREGMNSHWEHSPIGWCATGRYLAQRPYFTTDPLLHAGAYYVQEASSMFLEQAFCQTRPAGPARVLDLCAAPGGKSTHLLSLLQAGDVLVSNEVINSRVPVLAENVAKWGNANVIVTNSDPAVFGALGAAYDVVVVDAPCSGSGLFRKDVTAINEWSEGNVALCAQRQQRIIADVWPALKPGGVLIYATCSFSPQEDEEILDWLAANFECESVSLGCKEEWGVVHTQSPSHCFSGYRFYPYKLQGEGFFLAAMRKTENNDGGRVVRARTGNLKAEILPESSAEFVMLPDGHVTFLVGETWHTLTQHAFEALPVLQPGVRIRQAGVALGTGARKGFVPHHALALSALVSPQAPRFELPLEDALNYLRRLDISMPQQPAGFALMTFESLGLGWAKNLGNRVNNYYPTEWRIRK